MDRVTKVLCGTDLSQPADEALRQADAFARSHGARLVVVHVLPLPLSAHALLPSRQEPEYAQLPALEREALRALERRVADLLGRDAGAVDLIVEHGTPYSVLVEQAETLGADLVVVGGRGATGLKRLLLGSVASRVVRHAHAAVLIARESPRSGQVLVGTDFSDPSLTAVGAAVSEARRRAAKLTIVHSVGLIGNLVPSMEGLQMVATVSAERRQSLYDAATTRLTEALSRFHAEGNPVVMEGDAAVGITSVAEDLPAELVVVGTAGATGLRRMLLGSVAETVVELAPCSVLVVRPGASGPDNRSRAKESVA
jgi:nucleotide-binding universal stress UspA family protein